MKARGICQKTQHSMPTVAAKTLNTLQKDPKDARVSIDGGSSKLSTTKKASKGLKHVLEDLSKWKTASGAMSNHSRPKVKMMSPEFNSMREILWKFHVTEDLLNCDMITGRDSLKESGMIPDFSGEIIKWEESHAPMADIDVPTKDLALHAQQGANEMCAALNRNESKH